MSYGIRSAHNDFQIHRPIAQVWQVLYFEYHVDYDIVTVGDYHVRKPLYGIVTQNLNYYPEVRVPYPYLTLLREPELDTGEYCHVAKAGHVVDCCDAQSEVEYCYDAEAPVVCYVIEDLVEHCCISLHFTAFHFIYSAFHCISLHFSQFFFISLHFTALR